MQQGNDISSNNEVKDTITECISGNRIAGFDYLVAFDSSQSPLSFPQIKLYIIIREHIVMSTNATKYPHFYK